jgi:hypothetical protein
MITYISFHYLPRHGHDSPVSDHDTSKSEMHENNETMGGVCQFSCVPYCAVIVCQARLYNANALGSFKSRYIRHASCTGSADVPSRHLSEAT